MPCDNAGFALDALRRGGDAAAQLDEATLTLGIRSLRREMGDENTSVVLYAF